MLNLYFITHSAQHHFLFLSSIAITGTKYPTAVYILSSHKSQVTVICDIQKYLAAELVVSRDVQLDNFDINMKSTFPEFFVHFSFEIRFSFSFRLVFGKKGFRFYLV